MTGENDVKFTIERASPFTGAQTHPFIPTVAAFVLQGQ